jgi:hypothetical protein
MYTIQNTNLLTGSSTLTKYHVAKLDKSKAGGERCVDNEECKTGTCLSSGVCLSGIYFAVAQRFASIFYFKLINNNLFGQFSERHLLFLSLQRMLR